MQNFQRLSKAEMKRVLGGKTATFTCYAVTQSGGQGMKVTVSGDNIDQAQANADDIAWSNSSGNLFPYGIDCPGAE